MVRVVLCYAFGIISSLHAVAAQPTTSETLVMPFDSAKSDPKLYWLGEASALLLSEFLERYGGVVVAREERVTAFDRLQLPPAAALSHATVIKVAQLVGASDVIVGDYDVAGDQLTIRVRTIRLEQGRLGPEVIERGPSSDLLGLYDRAARRLRDASTPAPPPLSGALLASATAFELYVKGLVAEMPSTQRGYLEQASKAAPADDRVKLALWQAHTEMGDHLRALDAAQSVPPSSLHARTARYLAARSQIELKRYEDAFDTLKALDDQERSAEVLNAMGVVQLRRGSTSPTSGATYYFDQASQADPSDADYIFNLGYAYWMERDPPAAMYWLRETVRRDPGDADAHQVLAAALQHTGATAEATRERELAQRLSASYETRATPKSSEVPRGLERLKDDLARSANRVAWMMTSSEQRDQADVAAFHLDAGRRAFAREADREAERALRRALYISPYLAEGHLLLGRVYMRSGRAAEAIQALKIALWSEPSSTAHVALAEAYLAVQNVAAAKEEVDRALAMDPHSAAARAMRDKLAVLKPPH